MLNRRRHAVVSEQWHRTRTLTIALFSLWFLMTFLTLFFARELSALRFFDWPFSFYMAAQGLSLFYVGLLAIFSWQSHRIAREFRRKKASSILHNEVPASALEQKVK